jgi:YVTN family beta-propeller protein
VGYEPRGVAYDSAKGEVWVVNELSNYVSVINDTNDKVVANVSVGAAPIELAYGPGTGKVVVSNFDSDNVTVISDATNHVLANLAGIAGLGVAYDSDLGDFLVAAGNGLALISAVSDADLGTVVFGGPGYVAFDPTNGDVYASNYDIGTITVLGEPSAPTYPVAFVESGLPLGTGWSVTLGSTSNSSTTGTIGFVETDGTYVFTLGPVDGYLPTPASGSVTVADHAVAEPISFRVNTAARYAVTFQEGGLPAGTDWSVTLNGSTNVSGTSTVGFLEANGSYTYSVHLVVNWGSVPDAGSITVAGLALSEPITFVFVAQLLFDRPGGLAAGSEWVVTLTGPVIVESTELLDRSVSVNSTGSTISFEEPNGTYQYSVTSPGDSTFDDTGSLTLSGSAQTVTPAPVASPSTSTSSSGSGWANTLRAYLLYEVLGVVILVILAGVWIARRSPPPRP